MFICTVLCTSFSAKNFYVEGEVDEAEASFISPTCPSFMFNFATLPSASWISTWTSSGPTTSSVSCAAPPESPTLITPTIQVTPSAHSFISASVIALRPLLFLTSRTPAPDLDQQGFRAGEGGPNHVPQSFTSSFTTSSCWFSVAQCKGVDPAEEFCTVARDGGTWSGTR